MRGFFLTFSPKSFMVTLYIVSLIHAVMIPFPPIHPIAFAIGPLKIHWYGLCYVISICLCWWQAKRLCPKIHLPTTAIDNAITYLVFGIIIGGRLGYMLFYDFHQLLTHPLTLFTVWKGGMSFHGGFIGFMVAGLIYCHRFQVPILAFGDIFAITAPIGLFFGRIGNFINAEHYGIPTTLPFGVIFPFTDGQPRHPSQLYEALGEGIFLWAILTILFKRFAQQWPRGIFIGLFSLFYGIIRYSIEYVRTPDGMIKWQSLILSYGQILSLPMILGGVVFVLYVCKRRPC